MTTSFLGFDFFENNLNWTQFLPLLQWIAFIIGGMLIYSFFYSYYLQRKRRSSSWRRFFDLAHEAALTGKETAFIRRLIIKKRMDNPSRILLEQEHFERLVSHLEQKDRHSEQKYLQSIRQKVFGTILNKDEKIKSTERLPIGSRLLIEYLEYQGDMIRGELVDVDADGLIVVIPSDQSIPHALHINTDLNVLAHVHNRNSVLFRTWIKAVVPGPRRMIVLGHSSLVVENKPSNIGERVVIPAIHSADHLDKNPFYPSSRPHSYQ